jgi:hypothetical protein
MVNRLWRDVSRCYLAHRVSATASGLDWLDV